jgi:hypothetical protein
MVLASVRRLGVRQDPASEAECAAVLADSAGVYGGYLKYVQRISGRRVRIFLFEPV